MHKDLHKTLLGFFPNVTKQKSNRGHAFLKHPSHEFYRPTYLFSFSAISTSNCETNYSKDQISNHREFLHCHIYECSAVSENCMSDELSNMCLTNKPDEPTCTDLLPTCTDLFAIKEGF